MGEQNISAFLDSKGKIVQIPASRKKRIAVLAYLAGKFDRDRVYQEKEINRIIDGWHTSGDYFILRRLLIDLRFLERKRDGSAYRIVTVSGGRKGGEEWTENGN